MPALIEKITRVASYGPGWPSTGASHPGCRWAAAMHAHMLRHGCGHALANARHDTPTADHWLKPSNTRSANPEPLSGLPARLSARSNAELGSLDVTT
jgi:hypothetical protein